MQAHLLTLTGDVRFYGECEDASSNPKWRCSVLWRMCELVRCSTVSARIWGTRRPQIGTSVCPPTACLFAFQLRTLVSEREYSGGVSERTSCRAVRGGGAATFRK